MIESSDELLRKLRALEVELHQPQTRHNVTRLNELLHDEFVEFGSSGNTYTKGDILMQLPREAASVTLAADSFKLRQLAPDVALLTYRSAYVLPGGRQDRHALRSSIWEYRDVRWRMRFHQGTLIAHSACTIDLAPD